MRSYRLRYIALHWIASQCLAWHGMASRPNKICMNFGLSQNSEFCSENVSNSCLFLLSLCSCCLWRTLTFLAILSFSFCESFSLLLLHLYIADFHSFYCIIYRDKRFPFNINVKFIANIMQKSLYPPLALHCAQIEWTEWIKWNQQQQQQQQW